MRISPVLQIILGLLGTSIFLIYAGVSYRKDIDKETGILLLIVTAVCLVFYIVALIWILSR
ncbi:MAG: hypothetical protein JHC30_06145 [Caldisericum sp.]|nr:hypothetical protein [Caldisericum sp.]